MNLTPRQTQVMQLVADGRATKQIARELWITEETAKDHLRSIHLRLGVQNRSHAVAVAFRMGIIE